MKRAQNTPADLSVMAKRLRQAREHAAISQKALGILAGIDEFTASTRVNQYERGKHVPDFLTLERMADILKVPAEFFYARSDMVAEMLLLYSRLSERRKMEVLTSLRSQSNKSTRIKKV